MRSRRLLLAAALVVVGAGCNFPKMVPQGDAPLRYRDQFFTSFRRDPRHHLRQRKNLSNQTVTLKLDVYKPPLSDTITRRPAIVWVHGGAFCCGDKTATAIDRRGETISQWRVTSARRSTIRSSPVAVPPRARRKRASPR